MRRTVRIVWMALVVVAAIGGTIAWRLGQTNGVEMTLRTAPVKRSDLVATVGATGTVEPEEVVDVGAQAPGRSAHSAKTRTARVSTTGRLWSKAPF